MRAVFIRLTFVVLVLLGSVSLNGNARAQDSQILNALKQASKGQWSAAHQAMSKISDPVAHKAFTWLAYTDDAPNISFQSISSFIRQNPDFPYQITMRGAAEERMPASYSKAQVIGWFSSQKPVTAKGMNRYLSALVATGRRSEARKVMNDWWPNALLERDGQRKIFSTYQSLISSSAHKKRLNVLLYRGEYSNARAIAGVLGNSYKALTEARIGLVKQSNNVGALIRAVPASLQSDEGLLYERLRWRRRNDQNQGALALLKSSPSGSKMYDPSKWWLERHIMTRRYLENKNYRTAYQVAATHKQVKGFSFAQAEWISGFIALEFLNKPYEAAKHFNKLYKNVKSPVSKARAAYWVGRASDELKQPEVAQKWYAAAGQFSTRFYGQIALSSLKLPYQPSFGQGAKLPKLQKTQFARQDFARIAKWMDLAGLHKDAAAFLNKMADKASTPMQYALIADYAMQLGHNHVAISVSAKAEKETGVVLGDYYFPKKIQSVSRVKDVEWALIHALMRQESRFDHKAQSHAGARGLMQLMPATAKQTARKLGVSHQTSWLTSKPDHNILLGSRYLRQMLDRYDGSYPMAIAAYNAGPGRVDRWITEIGDPRTEQMDLINWIELIPIYETRNYVQRVMEGVYVYRHILGAQNKPASELHIASR